MSEITLSRLFEVVNPEHAEALKGMAAQAAITNDKNVGDLLKAYTPGGALYKALDQPQLFALLAVIGIGKDRFSAKLTFTQRCEILAMSHSGITRELLAKAYNIDRRTVTNIYNPNSVYYKNVREEELRMGRAEFQKTYLTQAALDRVMAFRQTQETEQHTSNNKFASKKKGPHTVRGADCEYPHQVVIAWKDRGDPANEQGDPIEVSGWYYNDMDGDFPNFWSCGDEESLRTSDACYRAMLKNIADRTGT